MKVTGRFEIRLTPQEDAQAPAGRMILDKTYQGAMTGGAVGQMISKRIAGGTAIYYAIEEFTGSLDGREGAFTLLHRGRMNSEGQSLEVTILEGSGSGDLEGITGAMNISQGPEGHAYELQYEIEGS